MRSSLWTPKIIDFVDFSKEYKGFGPFLAPKNDPGMYKMQGIASFFKHFRGRFSEYSTKKLICVISGILKSVKLARFYKVFAILEYFKFILWQFLLWNVDFKAFSWFSGFGSGILVRFHEINQHLKWVKGFHINLFKNSFN